MGTPLPQNLYFLIRLEKQSGKNALTVLFCARGYPKVCIHSHVNLYNTQDTWGFHSTHNQIAVARLGHHHPLHQNHEQHLEVHPLFHDTSNKHI